MRPTSYWIPKIAGNQQRDSKNIAMLREAGWNLVVVWECEISQEARLIKKLRRCLLPKTPDKSS